MLSDRGCQVTDYRQGCKEKRWAAAQGWRGRNAEGGECSQNAGRACMNGRGEIIHLSLTIKKSWLLDGDILPITWVAVRNNISLSLSWTNSFKAWGLDRGRKGWGMPSRQRGVGQKGWSAEPALGRPRCRRPSSQAWPCMALNGMRWLADHSRNARWMVWPA